MSIVTQVVDAIVAALAQAPAVAAAVERRSRARALPEALGSAVVVGALGAEPEQETLGFGDTAVWQVRIAVECLVRAGAAVDAALDALVQAVYARLMTDPTLGGAVPAGLSRPSLSYDYDALDARYASATLLITAHMEATGASL
ncbi:MAG: hypothetical protein N2688_00420 [Burkholderiaceae bacterium]|nr:hypothetical protein [Burkholderiaceae bacterium]